MEMTLLCISASILMKKIFFFLQQKRNIVNSHILAFSMASLTSISPLIGSLLSG